MKIRLQLGRADATGFATEHHFETEQITFGRSADNDLPVPDESKQVSSFHGRIELRSAGYHVVDLGSTNGTLLNGDELEPQTPLLLQNGDRIQVGDHEIRVSFAESGAMERTMVQVDPGRRAAHLGDDCARVWAEKVAAPPGDRADALRSFLQDAVAGLPADQRRAVLCRVIDTFAVGEADDGPGPGSSEELQRVGHEVLDALAKRTPGERKLATAADVKRFGALVDQTLEVTFDWIAKCLQGRRQFEDEFSANVTMMFSLAGNPLKSGKSPDEIGRFLLDWTSPRGVAETRGTLEEAFRDLTLHQLGLLAGAQEAVRAVLKKLDPKAIEELAAAEDKGWLSVLPKGGRAWDYYQQAFQEVMSEESRLFEELISPNIRKGYLAVHKQHVQDGKTSELP